MFQISTKVMVLWFCFNFAMVVFFLCFCFCIHDTCLKKKSFLTYFYTKFWLIVALECSFLKYRKKTIEKLDKNGTFDVLFVNMLRNIFEWWWVPVVRLFKDSEGSAILKLFSLNNKGQLFSLGHFNAKWYWQFWMMFPIATRLSST